MNNAHPPVEYKGRSLSIVFLIAAQVLVGLIHVVFGFWLLTATWISASVGIFGSSSAPDIYSVYTIVFGFLTLLFAVLLWLQKREGWVGTFAVLIFVIAADSNFAGFAKHSRNPKDCRLWRNYLQHSRHTLLISGSRTNQIRNQRLRKRKEWNILLTSQFLIF